MEELGLDWRIILEWMLGEQGKKCGMNASSSREGPLVSTCEHGNEPSGSIKCG
jgi:hypothetical protein